MMSDTLTDLIEAWEREAAGFAGDDIKAFCAVAKAATTFCFPSESATIEDAEIDEIRLRDSLSDLRAALAKAEGR